LEFSPLKAWCLGREKKLIQVEKQREWYQEGIINTCEIKSLGKDMGVTYN